MTRRDNALAALRAWSTPGRRADLIAAAWDEGENNISALAEAARVTRPTVYSDLRSRDIDPDQRPKEKTDMSAPVVIDGMDGSNLEQVQDLIEQFKQNHPADAADDVIRAEVARTFPLFMTVHRYNKLRPLLATELHARRDRDRALHLVETRWEALSSAANWLAAHHAYTVAVDDARRSIAAWVESATAAVNVGGFVGDEITVYEQRILAEGHPPIEPLTLDPGAVAEQLLQDLDQTHERRRHLAAETLGVMRQAGALT
ncbi:hypothetical protein QMK19_35345 [Streptomyces sp. H10-C2]|uniref:hypothetical protein n=1 Tax=unclassified Streptomyces TaxID=2593676 RepID=UPI0024B98009|nr:MULTISPECIES: hypothetical protein [unclassified Streptomyces]MDJ0345911.1 hypothetical protein [Streptomyces sp. PH10-H1]MDJ0374760.1 hypothetical protein [Streptomyces sp. H10-C2]